MLYALYNGEIISAEEIAEKESDETPVRRASGRRELRCIDPECECKTVFYRHGKVKRPHFSHAREGMNTSSFRRFSSEEALEWGRKHYSDWLINMQNKDNKPATPLEEFFRYYTQGPNVRINSIARSGNYLTNTNHSFSRQMFIDSIAEIKNHKLSENIVVYRYIPRALIKAMLKNGGSSHMREGACLIDNGYMSTTLCPEAVEGQPYANSSDRYLFTIYVPKGTPCVFVDLISDMQEREMLFAPGTKLQVISCSILFKKRVECIIINDDNGSTR